MIDQIQDKIKRLKKIEPSDHYSASSKSILLNKDFAEDKQVIANLRLLQTIQPDANYAFNTKLSILEAGKINRNRLVEIFTFKNFATSSMALGFSAILLGILITGGYKYLSPTSSISAANSNALLAEAETIGKDIDIHIKEIEYYATASRKTNLALNEAYNSDYGHLNNTVIERESGRINVGSPINQDIDDMLNEATL